MGEAVPLLLPVLTGSAGPGELWTALHDPVIRMVGDALGPGRPGPGREDLVAEATYTTLTNVTRYRQGFRGTSEGEARAWLRTVSRNALRRAARRDARWRKRHVFAEPAVIEALADRASGEAPVPGCRPEAWDLLVRAIPNPALRRLWLLHNRPGNLLTCTEIAAQTGRTPGSVAVSLSRARAAIRRELGETAERRKP